ncbi:hypothetical protein [Streptomyces kronopolitis]|uniref:hypothetical protein n=1 Tax=Streptomyces kronopolitis TaxID=1612435 RepID=UPI0036980755
MHVSDEYVRYRQDAQVLAEVGRQLAGQVSRFRVTLSREAAEAAVAAWERDETGVVGEETVEEFALRDMAAALALIGAAVTERGVWEDGRVVVDLGVVQLGAALQAVGQVRQLDG